jgi:hypothetical protein
VRLLFRIYYEEPLPIASLTARASLARQAITKPLEQAELMRSVRHGRESLRQWNGTDWTRLVISLNRFNGNKTMRFPA